MGVAQWVPIAPKQGRRLGGPWWRRAAEVFYRQQFETIYVRSVHWEMGLEMMLEEAVLR